MLVGEPHSEAEGAAKLIIDLGTAKLRRRRVEGVVDREEHLDCIGPSIGCAQVEIGDRRDPIIVDIDAHIGETQFWSEIIDLIDNDVIRQMARL